VVKKRVEKAGPVGEVDVWADAAVVTVAVAARMADINIALRIRSSLAVLMAITIVSPGRCAKKPPTGAVRQTI
jgi:hypothetical protein